MNAELHSREVYCGVKISIEVHDVSNNPREINGVPGPSKRYAAHVPVPGHGYIGRYFDTPDEALAAARALVDARPRSSAIVAKVCPTCGQQLPGAA